ncbi:hypothetical protein DFP74_1408 [Nocardiopsis sp. Huas11]|nr:hypothetical protein DFP74_1408 [Nocardiopsis sp. Huas11]
MRYLNHDHARLIRTGRTCRASRVRAYAPPPIPRPRPPADLLGALVSTLLRMGAWA